MLEPPAISAAELLERVRSRYALPVDEAEFLPAGLERARGPLGRVRRDRLGRELLAPRERALMFVDGGVGDLDAEGSAFYAGYGEAAIDPVVMAYYRFDGVVQELADYGRRVFRCRSSVRTSGRML